MAETPNESQETPTPPADEAPETAAEQPTPAPRAPRRAAPRKSTAPAPEAKAKTARRTTVAAPRVRRAADGASKRPTVARAGAAPEARAKRSRETAAAPPVSPTARPRPVAPIAASTTPETRAKAAREVTTGTPTVATNGTGEWLERVLQLNEPVVAAARQASLGLVEGYESAARAYVAYGDQLAEATPLEWVSNFTRAHTRITRHLVDVSAGAARRLLQV